MKQPIQISIPTPCHEDWAQMTPADKGRFCASCQKKVFDFTNASDREIVEAFNKNRKLCGRFLPSQLNRDITLNKTKSTFWASAGLAAISLFTLLSHPANARTLVKTEQGEKQFLPYRLKSDGNPKIISGIVKDSNGKVLPGVKIKNIVLNETTETDLRGEFKIKAAIGNEIRFTIEGYIYQSVIVKNTSAAITINMEIIEMPLVLGEPALSPVESIKNYVLSTIYNFFR